MLLMPLNPLDIFVGTGNSQHVFFEKENYWFPLSVLGDMFGTTFEIIEHGITQIKGDFDLYGIEYSKRIAISDSLYDCYSLDMVISLSYILKTDQSLIVRKSLTTHLKEFVVKGFIIDDKRLKDSGKFGELYFEELLERVREIRASERRFEQKFSDLLALSSDSPTNDAAVSELFSSVFEKFYMATTNHSPWELIFNRVDINSKSMGLQRWRLGFTEKILPSDTQNPANYLTVEELAYLNRMICAFLDLAETKTLKKQLITTKDWSDFIANYLLFSGYKISGTKTSAISKEAANKKALDVYERFRVIQDRLYRSDFDKLIAGVREGSNVFRQAD